MAYRNQQLSTLRAIHIPYSLGCDCSRGLLKKLFAISAVAHMAALLLLGNISLYSQLVLGGSPFTHK